jgi:hypothetical protein
VARCDATPRCGTVTSSGGGGDAELVVEAIKGVTSQNSEFWNVTKIH